VPGQRGSAGRDQARPGACAGRRAGQVVHRGAAGDPGAGSPVCRGARVTGGEPAAERVSPATKAARHAKIAGILVQPGEPVRSQEELSERLAATGIRVTQATLSRDLDELGAVRLRGAAGALVYAMPPDPAEIPVTEADDAVFRQAAAAVAGLAREPPGAPHPRTPRRHCRPRP